jgi:hypothetical protein
MDGGRTPVNDGALVFLLRAREALDGELPEVPQELLLPLGEDPDVVVHHRALDQFLRTKQSIICPVSRVT